MPSPEARLRCRHCHLTISVTELGSSCCPECLEVNGLRKYDFEEVADNTAERIRYRCEACGLIVDA
jgi:rubredoxin